MKHKIVDDELEIIEAGTFRQACERLILSLIIRPLRKMYKKKVIIQWPSECLFDDRVDFTKAYIFIENLQAHNKKYGGYRLGRLYNADIVLDFANDNLQICMFSFKPRHHKNDVLKHRHPTERVFFHVKEIPMANPHGHDEAIEHISIIIDHKLSEIEA